MPKKRKKMAQIAVSSTVVACAFVYTAPVNDKISQRLVLNSAAYRNTRHHLLRVPSSAFVGICRAENHRWLKPSASTA